MLLTVGPHRQTWETYSLSFPFNTKMPSWPSWPSWYCYPETSVQFRKVNKSPSRIRSLRVKSYFVPIHFAHSVH